MRTGSRGRIGVLSTLTPSHVVTAAALGLLIASTLAGAPRTAAADEPPLLRYQWKTGDAFTYEVRIEADRGEDLEVLQGTPAFVVKTTTADGATLVLTETRLASSMQSKNPDRPARPNFRASSMAIPGASEQTRTVDARGRVIQSRGEAQLPFVLGDLFGLLFEVFPEEARGEWERTGSTTIRISSHWPPRRLIIDRDKELLNAEEITTYKVEKTTAEAVTLARTYSLKTLETVDGAPRMELTSAGNIVLDRLRGVPTKVDFAGRFVVREELREDKYPLKVSCRLLSHEDVAAREKARTAPLTPEQRDGYLAALRSEDFKEAQKAMKELAKKSPPEPDDEIALLLASWLGHEHNFIRIDAANALLAWATPATVTPLLAALQDENGLVGSAAESTLARLKEETAIEPLVGRLGPPATRIGASKALVSMGQLAEAKVGGALASDDWQVRLEACKILSQIGTSESLPLLVKASATDENKVVKHFAKEAIKAIEGRQRNST